MNRIVRTLPYTATALALSLAVAACGSEARTSEGATGDSGMAAETGEHEGPERGAHVAAGEHDAAEGERSDRGERGERGEHAEAGESREGGEHGEAGHDEGGGEGEEGGEYIGIGEGWDATRNGARLTLAYDPGYDVFMGRVHNTTESTLCAVRVEVHLAEGPELGPTEPKDVPAGASVAVELPTGGVTFQSWTAHPEISRCGG